MAEPKKPKKSARSSPDKKPLTADEIRAIGGQLKAVLEKFEQIDSVNTKDVEPLGTRTDLGVHFREYAVVV